MTQVWGGFISPLVTLLKDLFMALRFSLGAAICGVMVTCSGFRG
ncbi:hypothetical protein OK016_08065 [Vibrio chagasii]|nr:hypothetical protein [Vibrio chagasii]